MSIAVKKQLVYLDNAASTPIDRTVKKEMAETMELYANPSSFNDAGRVARKKLEESRLSIARYLGARPEEVIFTSSGSEANNMAIFGLTKGFGGGEIITTPIEHPSILEPLKVLSQKGWKITYLKINKDGLIDLKDLEQKLNPRVKLVSIIYANNEIGTIQPINKISKIIKDYKKSLEIGNNRAKPSSGRYGHWKLEIDEKMYPFFHVDACQAPEYLEMNVNNLGVDAITFNGTKIYGPRGIGALYVRRGIKISPLIFGGDQEHGLRAGTENLPAIAGLAKAISLIDKKEASRVSQLRDYFFLEVIKKIPDVRINGPMGKERLPNNISISIPELSDENLLLELDKYGIYASSGSACTARSVESSHVLKAIGVEDKYLGGTLRFSLGRQTTKKDMDYVLKILPRAVKDVRKRYAK